MKCINCSIEFDSNRSSAKYCGPKCRKLAFLSGTKVSVPLSGTVSTGTLKEEGRAAICECVEAERNPECMACLRAGKFCYKKYFSCGIHRLHIDKYHKAMCYA